MIELRPKTVEHQFIADELLEWTITGFMTSQDAQPLLDRLNKPHEIHPNPRLRTVAKFPLKIYLEVQP